MSRFLKFSNRIVNTAFIKQVEIDKVAEKYTIHMITNYYQGVSIMGSGSFQSQPDIIWAGKKEHPESYKTIDDWINHMPQ